MLGYTTLAPPAVFAPKRCSYHARNTKVGLVILPLLEQVVNDGSLLGDAIQLGHEAGIISHARDIEEGGEAVQDGEHQVEYVVR